MTRGAEARRNSRPSEIDYVNAHGTSTPVGDEIELARGRAADGQCAPATHDVVDQIRRSAICSARPAPSRRSSAILAMRDQIAPPTLNLDNPSVETRDRSCARMSPRKRQIDVALSNSFGFGGTNASLIFRRAGVARSAVPFGAPSYDLSGAVALTSAARSRVWRVTWSVCRRRGCGRPMSDATNKATPTPAKLARRACSARGEAALAGRVACSRGAPAAAEPPPRRLRGLSQLSAALLSFVLIGAIIAFGGVRLGDAGSAPAGPLAADKVVIIVARGRRRLHRRSARARRRHRQPDCCSTC